MTCLIADGRGDVEHARCTGECPVDSVPEGLCSLHVDPGEHGPLATDDPDLATLPQRAATS